MSSEIERDFLIKETDPLIFYGVNDRNLKIIEKNFSVYLLGRGEKITITGPANEVDQVVELLSELIFIIRESKYLILLYLFQKSQIF